jgi:hypothetical protein
MNIQSTEVKPRLDVVFAGRLPVTNKSEGLFVLLCDLIRPLMEDGVRVVIHTTDRHAVSFIRELRGNGIDSDLLDLDVHSVGSLVLGYMDRRMLREQEKQKSSNILKKVVRALAHGASGVTQSAILWFADATVRNLSAKILAALGAALLVVALSVIGVPMLVIALTAAVLAHGMRRNIEWSYRQLRTRRMLHPPRLVLRAVMASFRRTKNSLAMWLFVAEQRRLAASLDRRASVSKLLFFTCFEGHLIAALRKKKLVVFPDAVISLFPTRFPYAALAETVKSIRLAVSGADRLICYSEFVRDIQLRRFFGKECGQKEIDIIPQGHARQRAGGVASPNDVHKALNQELVRIKNLFPTLMLRPPRPNFGEFKYVLYPSVDRQHKNTLTVVRAVEYLIRRRHLNFKLLTTTPELSADVWWYIHRQRLQYDVIIMPSVPPTVLELLFRGAAVAVHASFAEGGLPFTFSRAVSVDTPVILADVPVVREAFDRDGICFDDYGDWLYSPAAVLQLAARIEVFADCRQHIVDRQKMALAQIGHYDFRRVAYRYFSIYKSF